ncbi:hypothetical protein ONJ17_26875, partial [Salmonella enterica subsp. enterica serovar Agona]|nr:hypothetical protein [Salmonella enterica subsp. enterica serovar Agona]
MAWRFRVVVRVTDSPPSCYAGSFLPNTVQEKSVDINFAAPEHLTVSLDQVPGLIAGD